jgi:hypothetical protein
MNNRIYFDYFLYERIRKQRKLENLPINQRKQIYNHDLLNKKIKNIKTGKIYIVEKVYKTWNLGWYYTALVNCNDSHGCRFIENINCVNKYVLKSD